MGQPPHPIRVSVVVPVYNPGPHLQALVDSLAAQTMPQDEFEVIFADDGSTDDTPAFLDRLAAERANVRVLHEPNSGWPGRPRNLGTDAALGSYVFYVDQDDWLGVQALDRMADYADEHGSDIVIGRYAGHHRGVAKAPFRITRPDATLQNTPLMDSLTPHKMFRKSFLTEHELRFPEGRRRLEDHVFVVRAYFLARRIAIVADYHCYFHVRREDVGNAGYQRIDPAGYYGYVREVLEIIYAHTKPGALRDRCLRRPLRTELLARLDGGAFLAADPAYQRQLFDRARAVALESLPPALDAGLSAPQRVRAALLREDRLHDLLCSVEHYDGNRALARLLALHWDDSGALVLEVAGSLVERTSDSPWRYERDGNSVYLSEPKHLRGAFPRAAAECGAQLRSATLRLVLRRRADSEEWAVPTQCSTQTHHDERFTWLSYRASARLDPATLGGGAPLSPGVWDVYAQIVQTGWSKQARLGSLRTPEATAGARAAVLESGQPVVPYWTHPYDNLSLDVGAGADRLARAIRPAPAAVRILPDPVAPTPYAHASDGPTLQGQQLHVTVPLSVHAGAELPAARLRLAWVGAGAAAIEASTREVRRSGDGLALSFALPAAPSEGTWEVQLAVDVAQPRAPRRTGVALEVSGDGSVRVLARADPEATPAATRLRAPAPSRPLPRRIAGKLRRSARRVRRALRRGR
ncbi:MAG: glycosyltransferase family 2 protein [Jatrophihabitantaceae bacterium]